MIYDYLNQIVTFFPKIDQKNYIRFWRNIYPYYLTVFRTREIFFGTFWNVPKSGQMDPESVPNDLFDLKMHFDIKNFTLGRKLKI